MNRTSFASTFAALACVVACSSEPDAASSAGPAAPTEVGAPPSCTEGETRCEGDAVATCEPMADGTLAFAPAAPCGEDASCREGACVPATEKQKRQAEELVAVLDFIREGTGWYAPIDYDALAARGRSAIFRGDGSERAYFAALFDAFMAIPQGHQSLYLERGCGRTVPLVGVAVRGACGRPHPRGVIVTQAAQENALGLRAGDLVISVGDAKERGVLDELARRPMCATSRPSASYRDASVASTFADLLGPGETITVESPEGARRTVTVPSLAASARASTALSCQDPFGRDTSVPVEAYVRDDGIAVIRLPGFLDPEVPFPLNGGIDEFEAYRAKFEGKIQKAFDEVKTAKGIIWDVRGNGGGLTMVGLAIASGFEGASATPLSTCSYRVHGSSPPEFQPGGGRYALTPGGPFHFTGKVAVLVDGLDYSAADYFPLAVKERTSALLVGAPTAGAYGASSDSRRFAGPVPFTVSIDENRCELMDGTPLEGRSVEPHVPVDYDPMDLAAGRDTVLERAAAELSR